MVSFLFPFGLLGRSQRWNPVVVQRHPLKSEGQGFRGFGLGGLQTTFCMARLMSALFALLPWGSFLLPYQQKTQVALSFEATPIVGGHVHRIQKLNTGLFPLGSDSPKKRGASHQTFRGFYRSPPVRWRPCCSSSSSVSPPRPFGPS